MDMLRKRGVTADRCGRDRLRSSDSSGRRSRGSAGSPRRRGDGRIQARLSARRRADSPRHGESSKSVSKRDYYEILGVAKNCRRPANQKRVPQARPAISSGSQSGQQGRRREVQGGRRGLRDSLGRRKARALRPVRPRRRVVAGRRGIRSVDVRRIRGYLRRHLRRLLRRRPPRRPRARQRPALRPRDHVRRIGQGRRDQRFRFRGSKPARPATAQAPRR